MLVGKETKIATAVTLVDKHDVTQSSKSNHYIQDVNISHFHSPDRLFLHLHSCCIILVYFFWKPHTKKPKVLNQVYGWTVIGGAMAQLLANKM